MLRRISLIGHSRCSVRQKTHPAEPRGPHLDVGQLCWIKFIEGLLEDFEGHGMDSSFGPLDAFAFLVFAVLIFVGVIIVVNLGKLPGQLAHRWNHPQAAAINAMSWIGIATGGLLWPIAFIWAFTTPFGTKSAIKDDLQTAGSADPSAAAAPVTALRKPSGNKETRT
jgi:Protein of unknown function (DUF3302)